MKRKLLLLDVILALLFGIYSAAAWVKLRGAGAYRVGTTLGSVLAISRPYTTLAAVVLFAIAGIALVLHLRGRGTKKGAPAGEKIVPKKGQKPAPEEPKLQPAKGASAEEATVPLETETMAMETETTAMEETVALTPERAPMFDELDRPPVQPAPLEETPLRANNSLQCANCGAVLKPGQRFCSQCGTPAKGGGTT